MDTLCHVCGKSGKFQRHGAFHFCGNRHLRVFERSYNLPRTRNVNIRNLKLMARAYGDSIVAGRCYENNRMQFSKNGKYVPYVFRDASGKVLTFVNDAVQNEERETA